MCTRSKEVKNVRFQPTCSIFIACTAPKCVGASALYLCQCSWVRTPSYTSSAAIMSVTRKDRTFPREDQDYTIPKQKEIKIRQGYRSFKSPNSLGVKHINTRNPDGESYQE